MAHAYERIPVQKIEDQGGMIHKTLDVLEAFTDERPVGWLGPGLTQTLETPDLLAEAGIRYIADRVYDDEPTRISASHGALTTLPYTVELNDIAAMTLQGRESPYRATKCRDMFDRYYLEGVIRHGKVPAFWSGPPVSSAPRGPLHFHTGLRQVNGRMTRPDTRKRLTTRLSLKKTLASNGASTHD